MLTSIYFICMENVNSLWDQLTHAYQSPETPETPESQTEEPESVPEEPVAEAQAQAQMQE